MPGPGGGSRGGGGGFSGGSRGGGFGGGFSGGSRGGGFGGPRPGGFGGHHHHHHHGPHFGWGFGRRRYYGGGGCLGAFIAPFVIAIFLIFAFVYMLLPSGNVDYSNGNFGKNYDEAAFQRAADAKYAEYFESGKTYEDNILLYFLVEEDCEDIYFIAWVGDNINYDIAELFGNNYTALGQSIEQNVANYYAHSLDSNLAAVIKDMERQITKMELSSFKSEPVIKADPADSKLVDLTYRVKDNGIRETDPKLTAETVNDALVEFTLATGIRTVVCVDYIDSVFETRGGMSGSSVFLILSLIILGIAIFIGIKSSKKGK